MRQAAAAEAVFEQLGAALDRVGDGDAELFLCKLCLLLGLHAGEEAMADAISRAEEQG